MKKGILAFQSALAATIAINANKYLITNAKLDEFVALIMAAALSVMFSHILDYILSVLPRKVSLFRKMVDPRSKFEGAWMITIDDIPCRPYSYAVVEYNKNSENYTYYGAGFSADGKLSSTWESSELTFDHAKNEMRFFADAQLADEKEEMLKNWGRITFAKESFGNRYERAKGFFVDFGTNFIKSHFYMDRLSQTDIKSLTGKESVKSHDDMSDLICAYHKNKLERNGGFVDRHSYPLPFSTHLVKVSKS